MVNAEPGHGARWALVRAGAPAGGVEFVGVTVGEVGLGLYGLAHFAGVDQMFELAVGGLVAPLMADAEAHTGLLAGGDGALPLGHIQHEGFFDKNMFARRGRLLDHPGMHRMRGGENDGVHLTVLEDILPAFMRPAAVLARERLAGFLCSRKARRHFDSFGLFRRAGEFAAPPAQADKAGAHGIFIIHVYISSTPGRVIC